MIYYKAKKGDIMRLKGWVKTTLIAWASLDFILIAIALYMQRLFELGL